MPKVRAGKKAINKNTPVTQDDFFLPAANIISRHEFDEVQAEEGDSYDVFLDFQKLQLRPLNNTGNVKCCPISCRTTTLTPKNFL